MYPPQPILGKMKTLLVPAASVSALTLLEPPLAGITDDKFIEEFESRVYISLKSATDITIAFEDPTLPTTQPITLQGGKRHEFYYTGDVYIQSASDVEVIVGY